MIPFMIPPIMLAMRDAGKIAKALFSATVGVSAVNTALAVSTFRTCRSVCPTP